MLTDFLDSVRSFALSRVLMTAIELDVFRQLDERPLSKADLRKRTGIKEGPISDAFIDVLVAFKILNGNGDKLELSETGRSILPAYESIRSWAREMQLFYDSLCDLTGLVKSGDYKDSILSDYWIYKKSRDPKKLQASEVNDYSSLMDASQMQLSHAIMDHHDFSGYAHIIDFGGGYGRLAIALAEKYPGLRITIADLPAVCEKTRALVDAEGLGGRIDLLPVDFFRDPLPVGVADAIVFVRVLHDWDGDETANLLAKTRSCLCKDGTALVIEPMNDDSEQPTRSSALTSLMITLFGGKRRSMQEYAAFLRSVGYTDLSWSDCGLSLYRIVAARSRADSV
ncbi:methyltransferase domain-containing protein [Candidatus Poribacteria bacterium]|nr:methyltransferase domain-containing protein [Candidatus Poribacteria bacterium]